MNPLDRLTTIISRLMGKNPDDPDVLEAVVEVVMAIRPASDEMRAAGWDAASDYFVPDNITMTGLQKYWQAMIDALLTEGEG